MVKNIQGILEVNGTELEAIIDAVEPLSEEWHAKHARPEFSEWHEIKYGCPQPAPELYAERIREFSEDIKTPEGARKYTSTCYRVILLVRDPADSSRTIRNENWPVKQENLTPENSTVGNRIRIDAVEHDGVIYDVTGMPCGHGSRFYLRPLFDSNAEPIDVIGDLDIK